MICLGMFTALIAAITAAVSAPQADDIQAVEYALASAPYLSQTRDGRAFVEFGPTVEVRNVNCSRRDERRFDCTYEVREKEFFDSDFASWQPKRKQLIFTNKCWKIYSLPQ